MIISLFNSKTSPMNMYIILWLSLLFFVSCGKEVQTSEKQPPHEMISDSNKELENDASDEIENAEKEFTQELNSLLQSIDEPTD